MKDRIALYVMKFLSLVPIPAFYTALHFNHNISCLSARTGLIENQRQDFWKKLRFGLFSMRYDGCAAIAVINACRLLGKDMSAQEEANFIREIERHKLVLFGLLGTSPLGLTRLLRQQRSLQVEPIQSPDAASLHHLSARYDVFLICAWNDAGRISKGIHFFAAEKHGGRFFSHNTGYWRQLTSGEREWCASPAFDSLAEAISCSSHNPEPQHRARAILVWGLRSFS